MTTNNTNTSTTTQVEASRPIRIGISQGDTNGVGYELIFKTFSESTMFELCTPIVFGHIKVATLTRSLTSYPLPKRLYLENSILSIAPITS